MLKRKGESITLPFQMGSKQLSSMDSIGEFDLLYLSFDDNDDDDDNDI